MPDAGRKLGGCALLAIIVSCDGTIDPQRLTPATGYYALAATGLDATGRTVVGFNKHGDIALNDGTNAYRYHDGALTQLNGVSGATATRAVAMNEAGVVVGRSATSAVRWDVGSETPVLPPIPVTKWLSDIVADINDAGDAILEAGLFSTAAGRDTAFIVWTSQDGIETISSMQFSMLGANGSPYARRMNNSREILAFAAPLHSWVTLLSPLQRPAPTGGGCEAATQVGPVALNDSGAYITAPALKAQCLVRPGKLTTSLRTFGTGRTGLNNNFWMAGQAADGPVLATHPDTVVAAHDLFETEADRDGWTIEQFVALNDNNHVLAVATKGSRREFVVLAPRGLDH